MLGSGTDWEILVPSQTEENRIFYIFYTYSVYCKKKFRENVISINIFLDNVKQMIALAMFLFAAYPEVFDR